jgi:hypothetical protein
MEYHTSLDVLKQEVENAKTVSDTATITPTSSYSSISELDNGDDLCVNIIPKSNTIASLDYIPKQKKPFLLRAFSF